MFKNLWSVQRLGWGVIAALLIVLVNLGGCTMTAGIDPEAGRVHGSIETIWDGKDD